jgi:protein-L-isoaspartate(D-aspartate) O-methyltransferase
MAHRGQQAWYYRAGASVVSGPIRKEQHMTVAREKNDRMEFLLTLRKRGIGDAAVLRAMEEVPREHFVGPENVQAAYYDQALPIACGQTISQPYVVAYMTEQLRIHPHDRVLEIGTGSGYQAAVLAKLAREVVTIERYRTLAETARKRFDQLGIRNIEVLTGDGFLGAPNHAPFQRIIVTAAAEEIPQALVDQLDEGGVMVLPLGPHAGPQQIVRLTKTKEGLKRENLIPVRFVPMVPGKAQEL